MSYPNFGKFLFLSVGLTSVHPRPKESSKREVEFIYSETDGSKACRRNILALASAVVVAGASGADPSELVIFGVEPNGARGTIVISVAVVLASLYWYIMRYRHLIDDAEKQEYRPGYDAPSRAIPISAQGNFPLRQKSASLFSNWIAFLMTIASWYCVFCWMIGT